MARHWGWRIVNKFGVYRESDIEQAEYNANDARMAGIHELMRITADDCTPEYDLETFCYEDEA